MMNIRYPMRVIYKIGDKIQSYVCETAPDKDRVLDILNACPDMYEVIKIETLSRRAQKQLKGYMDFINEL